MIVEAAKTYLKNPMIQERLLGGMSNYTYVVLDQGKQYTVRVLGEHADLFVDRNEEAYHIKHFESLHITSKTLYFDINTGIKVGKYIKGDILSQIDPIPHLDKVSQVLKTIHQGPKSKYEYQFFKRLEKYESINKDLPKEYYEIKSWVKNLHNTVYKNIKTVLCHGDSQPSNFILTNKGLIVVDFEFSGNNDPYYDIACFGNIHFEYAILLLDVYLGRKATKEERKRLYYNRILQAIQWFLVAKFKHEAGMSETLKIPFDVFMNKYLDLALKLKGEYNH